MNITVYKYYGDERVIVKEPLLLDAFSSYGIPKMPFSIIEPIIDFYKEPERLGSTVINDAQFEYNYLYIIPFDRYYYIRKIEVIGNFVYRLYCSVDVLSSFFRFIFDQSAYILRNEYEFNKYQLDEYVVSDDYKQVDVKQYNIQPKVIPSDGNLEFRPTIYLIAPAGVGSYPNINMLLYPNSTPSNILWEFESYTDYTDFMRKLLDPTLRESFSNFFQNPSDFITDMFILPFKLSTYINSTAKVDIIVGNGVAIGAGKMILPTNRFRFYYDIQDNFTFNSFTDYEPISRYHIQLPFIGLNELESIAIDGEYNKYVIYDVDIYTGDVIVSLSKSAPLPSAPIVDGRYTWSGNIKIDLPLGSSNKNSVNLTETLETVKLVLGLGSIAGGAATAMLGSSMATPALGTPSATFYQGLGGLQILQGANAGINSIENLMQNIPQYSYRGKVGSVIDYWKITFPIMFKTFKHFYFIDNHNRLFGRPLNETRLLIDLYGFTKVGSIEYTTPLEVKRGLSYNLPYNDELIMITNLLKNGVYLQSPIINSGTELTLLRTIYLGSSNTGSCRIRFQFNGTGVIYGGLEIKNISGSDYQLNVLNVNGGFAFTIEESESENVIIPEEYRYIKVYGNADFGTSLGELNWLKKQLINKYIGITNIF